jgi:hypothetical protein
MRCGHSKNKSRRSGVAGNYERAPAQLPFFIPSNHLFERQADEAAEKIIRYPKKNFFVPNHSVPASPVSIQRKENSSSLVVNDPVLDRSITSSGEPMDRSTKEFMESRFEYNFDSVRIHNDSLAHQSAEAINARAYTNSNHIIFGNGEYQPNSNTGKTLLAHELVHTMQQKDSRSMGAGLGGRTIQRKDKAEKIQPTEEIPKELPCKPTALSRQAFLKTTKTTDFGLTKISVNQADLLSSPYIQFTKVGRQVKMEPLSLNVPVIESNYVQSGQFIEGQTKNKISSQTCPLDYYPINWNITSTGAASLEEAEQEHCNDYNYAFNRNVYPFLVEVNKAAAAGRKFNSTTAADAYIKKKLGFDPHDWFNRFTCMLANSTIRDHPQDGAVRAWHEPNPVTQVLPNARNLCKHITLGIIPSSFSGLNNLHPTDVIVPTGCK